MKINIRHNAFETNSSSTHMYSFALKHLETARKGFQEIQNIDDGKLIIYGAYYKAMVVDWLMDGEIEFPEYYVTNNRLFKQLYFSVSEARHTDKYINKIRELMHCGPEINGYEVTEKAKKRIEEHENMRFNDVNFNYPIYLEKGKVVDKLTDEDRAIIALKLAIFNDNDLSIPTGKSEEHFFDILNKELSPSFFKTYYYLLILESQFTYSAYISAISKNVFESIDEPFDRQELKMISSIPYCEYRMDDLIGLGIDFSTYTRFKKSIIDLIYNDEIVIYIDKDLEER